MNAITKSNLDIHRLKEVAQDILKEAARAGATQAEVGLGANKGFTVGARGGDVETVEYHQDKDIDITVYFGKRLGSASLSDLRPEAIRAAVEAACHIAKFTDEDPAAGIAEKSELAFDYPELNLNHPWNISVEQAIEMACQCEKEAVSYDKRIMSAEEVSLTTLDMLHVYANSNGFMGAYPLTRHDMTCVMVAKENNDMQRDYAYTVAIDPAQLQSVSHIAIEAADKAVKRLGARKLKTMKTPVIYLAEEARGLLGHFSAAIQGGSIYRKSSFLVDHLDKQIFSDFVHLQEHPHLPLALGSSPFDDNGVATRSNVFVENGVLRQYSLGIYAAKKLGLKTTGNAGGTHNLTIKPGNQSLAELIKQMNRGLLITEMMGHGVNMITGDYSRGVGGYWIENGEIQYPVHEVTVAGKLQDMYRRMIAVGNDVDTRGNIRTGSILIEEMMVAGT